MTKLPSFRIVIAQSVLTEIIVQAPDPATAENAACDAYDGIGCILSGNQWIGDGFDIVTVDPMP